MLITEEFILMGMHDYELNKAQFKILNQKFPPVEGWESLIIGKEITKKDADLFLLLRGKLALKAQDQIIKNYQYMLDFNSDEVKIEQKSDDELINSKNSLKIYCDGACLDNPGKSGSGLSIYHNGNKKPMLLYGEYVEFGTNNTAELNALYKALTIASESEATDIIIFSDSKYSIDCVTKWAYGWKSNSWTKKGGEIKNIDVIKLSHTLYDTIKDKIIINHVKGHSGVEGNELADRMAMMAIKSQSIDYAVYEYENVHDVLELTI
jgi:ribonuclease HI